MQHVVNVSLTTIVNGAMEPVCMPMHNVHSQATLVHALITWIVIHALPILIKDVFGVKTMLLKHTVLQAAALLLVCWLTTATTTVHSMELTVVLAIILLAVVGVQRHLLVLMVKYPLASYNTLACPVNITSTVIHVKMLVVSGAQMDNARTQATPMDALFNTLVLLIAKDTQIAHHVTL